MPKYRSGAAAIEAAAAKGSGGGGRTNFAPEIFWKEDNEKKYILVLTPADEVGAFDLHEFIKLKGEKANGESYEYFASFMSRKDPFIGEDYDKIEDDLDRTSKTRCMGVAVELVPVMETVKGRKRPTGFSVKTDSFTRNTEDGEEEVVKPVIGLITQSSKLMWRPLNGLDQSQGPLEDLPLEVTRHIPNNKPSETFYEFIPFVDIPVDLSAITDHLDGISYFNNEELDELVNELESIEDNDLKRAQAVARALMAKRVEELADGTRYQDLLGDVDELPAPPWGGGNSKKKETKRSRPSRPSPRKKAAQEESDSDETPSEEPSKEDKFARLKARLGDK